MHRLVTCLIHLFKILYLHLQVSESSEISMQALDGQISHICPFILFILCLVVATGTLSEQDCDTIRACRSPKCTPRSTEETETVNEVLEGTQTEIESMLQENSNENKLNDSDKAEEPVENGIENQNENGIENQNENGIENQNHIESQNEIEPHDDEILNEPHDDENEYETQNEILNEPQNENEDQSGIGRTIDIDPSEIVNESIHEHSELTNETSLLKVDSIDHSSPNNPSSLPLTSLSHSFNAPLLPTEQESDSQSQSASEELLDFPPPADFFSEVSSDEENSTLHLGGKTILEFLRSEEEQMRLEIARLQKEDAERLQREREERERWIDSIRKQNYVLSSDEEEEWKEEEEEASRRRTLFVASIGREMEKALNEIRKSTEDEKLSPTRVIQFTKTKSKLQKRIRENDVQQKKENAERRKREMEQRQLAARNRAITDQKQRQKQEELRKERRAFEKKLREEDLERQKKERERRQRDEQQRLKRLSMVQKQKEEEKKRREEKKKQWLEEKRRLEEEEKRKEEMEKQRRRRNMVRFRNDTTKQKPGCVG